MSDEPTTAEASESIPGDTTEPASSATRARFQHPVWLVLIGVLASSAVFLIGGAVMHHGGPGHRGFDGHRTGMMGGRGGGPGGAWGGREGGFGRMGEHGMMRGGPGMMDGGPGMMDGRIGMPGAAATGADPHTLMQNALKSLGVSDAELAAALTKQVDKLEKVKSITADQADAMRAHIKQQHTSASTPPK